MTQVDLSKQTALYNRMDCNFIETVLTLHEKTDWKNLLKLNSHSNNLEARKLLWVWPSTANLNFIKKNVSKLGCTNIVSIGCGCGLLEWIINKSTDLPVTGYEVNEAWWKSKYCNPQFIKLKFLNDLEPLDLQIKLDPNSALLFCYFNNGAAFIDYIREYKGRMVIIIGPATGNGNHTNPEPFCVDFGGTLAWSLLDYQEVKTTRDFIAIYTRKY